MATARYTWSAVGSEFARAAYNVATTAKTNKLVDTARLSFEPGRVEIAATDGFVASRDWCPVYSGPETPVMAAIPLDALGALDKTARLARSEAIGLTWIPGDGLILDAGDVRESAEDRGQDGRREHEYIDDLFREADEGLPEPQRALMLSPVYMARFRTIKPSTGKAPGMDLLLFGEDAPVFIRIGPSFKALVQPIDRERHAAYVGPDGQDGLW